MEASAQQCSTSQEAKDGDCVKGNTFKRRKPHLHRWLPPALRQWWQKLRAWAWYLLEELFEEFQPWFKWLIFDAFFTLVLGLIVQRFEALRPLAEAVGWL